MENCTWHHHRSRRVSFLLRQHAKTWANGRKCDWRWIRRMNQWDSISVHTNKHAHTQADRLSWSSRRFVLFSEDVWAQCTCRHWSTNKPQSQTRPFMYSVFLCSGVCKHVCMRTGTDPIKLSRLKTFLCSSSELLDRQPASCDLQMAGTQRFLRRIKKLQDAAFLFSIRLRIVKSVFWLMVSWRGLKHEFCREKERKSKGRGREGAE